VLATVYAQCQLQSTSSLSPSSPSSPSLLFPIAHLPPFLTPSPSLPYSFTSLTSLTSLPPPSLLLPSLSPFCAVLDKNDNPPVFDTPIYTMGNTEVVSSLSVRTQDMDVGDNGEVWYGIVSGNEAGSFVICKYICTYVCIMLWVCVCVCMCVCVVHLFACIPFLPLSIPPSPLRQTTPHVCSVTIPLSRLVSRECGSVQPCGGGKGWRRPLHECHSTCSH